MIAAYLFERFRPAMFVPVALAIALCASAAGDPSLSVLAQDFAFTLLLLLQFRVWDDLADRQVDAVDHPHRTLVTAPSVAGFVALCVALALANFVFSTVRNEGSLAVWVLVVSNGGLALWYSLRSRRSLSGIHLLLAKYPAFVFIVAGDRAADSVLAISVAATVVYVAAVAYEGWHDPKNSAFTFLGGRP